MNKWKNLLIAISSNRIWFITFMCLDLFFIFLAWLAYPEYFTSYVETVAELGAGCISRWKDGKVSPNIDTLKKIANVIGVKVADLVKE